MILESVILPTTTTTSIAIRLSGVFTRLGSPGTNNNNIASELQLLEADKIQCLKEIKTIIILLQLELQMQ